MKPLNYDTVICRTTALIYNYPDEADRNASSGFISLDFYNSITVSPSCTEKAAILCILRGALNKSCA